MVSFHDSPESYSDDRMRVHIDSEVYHYNGITHCVGVPKIDILHGTFTDYMTWWTFWTILIVLGGS